MPTYKNGLARVGKVYHYCFRINGEQFKGSTRATDKATAEKLLAKARQDALLGPQEEPQPIPTLSKLIEAWLASYERTYSPRHIESVKGFAKRWINPALGDLPVDRIYTQRVLDLRAEMLNQGRSQASANLMLRILKLLMSYAIRLGHIQKRPFSVAPLRIQRKPRPVVPASMVKRFLEEAEKVSNDPQVGVMLAVMIGCGLRASELVGMRWEWFDLERRTYSVGKAKGKEARLIPIPTWLWDRIMTMPKRLSGWVFPTADGNPHPRNHLRGCLRKVCERLELGHVTQHRLRSSFASLHAEAGTPLSSIQNLLGHKQIQTTMIYIEQSLENKRKAQDALSQKLGLA